MGIMYKKLGEVAEIIPGIGEDKLSNGACKYSFYQPNSLAGVDELSPLPTVFRNEPISENQIVKKDDIIIKRLNHDRAYIAPEVIQPTTISQNLFLLRVSRKDCLPEYLAFLFEQQDILSQITQVSGSAAPIRALSAKMLLDISIPIVPTEKQRLLGAIWKLSKRRQSLLEKLEIENNRLMTAVYNKYIGKEAK